MLALSLAAALRLLRVPARWDEVSWLYAAYNAPTAEALRAGDLAGALGFIGLHPPLYPLLHAGLELLYPAPLLPLLLSAAASLGAVWAISRAGRDPAEGALAALVLACGPVQLAYAAELNNYPLTALSVALTLAARQRAAAGGGWGWLAAAGALACWTHALAAWVAGLAALTLGRRGLAVLGVMALSCLPLAPEVLRLIGEENTYKQPPIKPALIFADYTARFGWLWLGLLPFGALGARRRPALGATWLGTAGFIAALQLVRIAAPHQFPYHLALGCVGAPLVAAGAAGAWRWGAAGLALTQGLSMASLDVRALAALARDDGGAMAAALERASPGEAVYLLAPSWADDDDKRLTSAPLWRLPPWRPMPPVRPYDFEGDDFRHGQPRAAGEVVIYVADWPRREVLQAAAAHPRLYVVVDQPGGDPRYTSELAERLGVQPEDFGDQLLFVVTGPPSGG